MRPSPRAFVRSASCGDCRDEARRTHPHCPVRPGRRPAARRGLVGDARPRSRGSRRSRAENFSGSGARRLDRRVLRARAGEACQRWVALRIVHSLGGRPRTGAYDPDRVWQGALPQRPSASPIQSDRLGRRGATVILAGASSSKSRETERWRNACGTVGGTLVGEISTPIQRDQGQPEWLERLGPAHVCARALAHTHTPTSVPTIPYSKKRNGINRLGNGLGSVFRSSQFHQPSRARETNK
jgi:hypothetical protein